MQFNIAKGAKKSIQEIVGVDIGTSGVKVVRIKKTNNVLTLVGADILPPVSLSGESASSQKPAIPKPLTANYAAITFSTDHAVVRVMNMTAHANEAKETRSGEIREHLGLDAQHRVAYLPLIEGKSKTDARMLTVAIPETDVQTVLSMFASGAPAPFSLEVSGLSALNAYVLGPMKQVADSAVCVIESGARMSTMAIFNKGTLALSRKLDIGGDQLLQHVQKRLGVDAETARSILSEGSVDISHAIRELVDPFLRQLTISRDFVEREENCRISKVFLSGGMCLSKFWTQEIFKSTGMSVETWNPFEGLTLAPNAYPQQLEGQQSRFVAAVGAALGVLTPS